VPSPTPYPVGGSPTVLFSDDFTAWRSNWAVTGDAVIVGWWQPPVDQMYLAGQAFGFWVPPGPDAPPFDRGTKATRVITGLPANRFVSVAVDSSWRLANFVTPASFMGLYVNAAKYGSPIGPSGTLTAPTVKTIGFGTTNGAGALTLALGTENIHPSMAIDIGWDNVTVYDGYYDPDPFRDLLIDTAVAYLDENKPLSISRGSLAFDPRAVFQPMDFDGQVGPVAGGDELVSLSPVVTGNLMFSGERHIAAYFPGGTWADSSYGRTYTPVAPRTVVAALTGFRVIWQRLRGDYLSVRFPKALCRAHALSSQDKDEGLFAVEVEARQDLAGNLNPRTTPFFFYDILPIGAAA
jgi:hypothetical protein